MRRFIALPLLILVSAGATAQTYEPGRYQLFGYVETLSANGLVAKQWIPQQQEPTREMCVSDAHLETAGKSIPADVDKKIGTTYGIFVCLERRPDWQEVR